MVFLIIWIAFGIIAALIAHSKGRNAIGWFFIGFLLGIIGIIIAAVVSNLKEQAEREERMRRENRRLRERVRKDRMVADRRHRQIDRRLKAHDRVLNLDTRQREDELAGLEYQDDEDDYEDDEDEDSRSYRRQEAW